MFFRTWQQKKHIAKAAHALSKQPLSPLLSLDPTTNKTYRPASAPNAQCARVLPGEVPEWAFMRDVMHDTLTEAGKLTPTMTIDTHITGSVYQRGDYIKKHDDKGRFFIDGVAHENDYTLLCYLTPCIGGELLVDRHTPIAPLPGTMVLFDAACSHLVKPVIHGSRSVLMARAYSPIKTATPA